MNVNERHQILKSLCDGVVNMNQELVISACNMALESGIDPSEAIMEGLTKGMEVVSQKYEDEEYFVPEVMMCSDAMNEGLKILRLHIKTQVASKPEKIVIGVVQGDIHDIGKNLVKIMMETVGLEVHDLGHDVPLNKFFEKAQEVNARIICMSTLMTSTMDQMKEVMDILAKKGVREKYLVMIGGAPISQSFADAIGANAYASNAAVAAKKAKQLASTVL